MRKKRWNSSALIESHLVKFYELWYLDLFISFFVNLSIKYRRRDSLSRTGSELKSRQNTGQVLLEPGFRQEARTELKSRKQALWQVFKPNRVFPWAPDPVLTPVRRLFFLSQSPVLLFCLRKSSEQKACLVTCLDFELGTE